MRELESKPALPELELDEDVFSDTEEDFFANMEEDVFADVEEDVFSGTEEDVFSGCVPGVGCGVAEEEIFPEVPLGVLPGGVVVPGVVEVPGGVKVPGGVEVQTTLQFTNSPEGQRPGDGEDWEVSELPHQMTQWSSEPAGSGHQYRPTVVTYDNTPLFTFPAVDPAATTVRNMKEIQVTSAESTPAPIITKTSAPTTIITTTTSTTTSSTTTITTTTTTTTTTTKTTTTSTTTTTTSLLAQEPCLHSQVYMDGSSWMELSRKVLPHRQNMKTIIKLKFATRQNNSLLLWQVRPEHLTLCHFVFRVTTVPATS